MTHYPEWGKLEPCYLVVESTPEGIRRDNENCRKYYDVVYEMFMDKAKGRDKIEQTELLEITKEISKQLPDVKPYVVQAILDHHGWGLWYEGDGDVYESAISKKGWVYRNEIQRRNVERYDRLYQKFMDKVKNRRKIPYGEFTKISMEIDKENPEFRICLLGAVLYKYGWRIEDHVEGDEIEAYMVKK